ncbi:MAG: helix-turn-helix domain-containing protein [Haliscomenobacteraceae bacterium CHB4]|nr:helix-turn-helix domain-containing protein [Haliscomenobacteraceae bacterium CHB4]
MVWVGVNTASCCTFHLPENRVSDSIAQVASKVGYDDARYFARSFRQRFGKLSSEMRGE